MAEKAEREGRSRDVTELLLFHGTDSLDTVRGIAINNFDHRLSGKNATMYGEGAYFAKNAKYSHAYTKPPDHFMFLARVLIGEYTKGERSYKRPPSKPGAAHELYDTCVDNISSPSIYIVFDTKQYYPEFLIQYHSIVESRVPTRKPAVPTKPVISAKPVIAAKPVVAPKPSIYDQTVAYQSSPVSYPSSAVSYPTSPVSYPTSHVSYPSSAVNNPSTARRRSPSPPRTIGGHSDSGYTSYPSSTPGIPSPTPLVYPQHTSAYPGYVAARSPSPPRQATIASASTSHGDRDKDKSCVIQ